MNPDEIKRKKVFIGKYIDFEKIKDCVYSYDAETGIAELNEDVKVSHRFKTRINKDIIDAGQFDDIAKYQITKLATQLNKPESNFSYEKPFEDFETGGYFFIIELTN